MPRFFLSYRQSDMHGRYLTHMLFREIRKRYGDDSVFLDVDSRRPGLSFPEKLEIELERTDAVLVIIGRDWLACLHEKRENERDWVRFEISESLKREGLPVVPVCLAGVSLPETSQLPPELKGLAVRDGVSLDPFQDFDSHLNRFLIDLEKVIESVSSTKARGNRKAAVAPIKSADFSSTLKNPRIHLNVWSVGKFASLVLILVVAWQFDVVNLLRPYLTKPETTPVIQPDVKPVPHIKLVTEAPATPDAYPVKPFFLFRDSLKDGTSGPEMVSLPGGSFQMGSPRTEADRYDDEGPQHRVSLQPFAISRTEVSFADYDRFAAATGRRKPDQQWGRDTQPVINVNWQDAKAYAQWLSQQTGKNYRLPTEAEWEYAARAGTTTAFWTGNCIDTDQANYNGNYDYAGCGAKTGKYRQRTVPVGSLPANPWGLYEMAGNVWEWTEDCWHDNYQNAPTDGSAWSNDAGGDCARRVLRGGSWGYSQQVLRSAIRFRGSAEGAFDNVGIRLARTP